MKERPLQRGEAELRAARACLNWELALYERPDSALPSAAGGQGSRTDEASLKVDVVLLPTSRSNQCDFDLYSFPGECSGAIEYDC